MVVSRISAGVDCMGIPLFLWLCLVLLLHRMSLWRLNVMVAPYSVFVGYVVVLLEVSYDSWGAGS